MTIKSPSEQELGIVISELLAYINVLEGWLDPEEIAVARDVMEDMAGPTEAPSSYGMVPSTESFPREWQ